VRPSVAAHTPTWVREALQFVENVLHVRSNGSFRDAQVARDLPIRSSGSDQSDDLPFARTQQVRNN
jgi:hypothetical protein